MQKFIFKVNPGEQDKRLDLFLLAALKAKDIHTSRVHLKSLIGAGLATKEGKALKAHYKLKLQDVISLDFKPKETIELEAQNIPLEVIYEDEDILVVNKPTGMVVHPAPGNLKNTLVNALLFHCERLPATGPLRPGIVHRLDKDASGLMVVAKNNASYLSLVKQFREHKITRKYLAIVSGRVEFDEGVIDLPIAPDPSNYKKMTVRFSPKAKEAKTVYRTLKRARDYSLLELLPRTGRTHQLRVHLKSLGHPILGDTKYGKDKKYPRLFLHATQLGFTHPQTKKFMEFNLPIPKEFKELIG